MSDNTSLRGPQDASRISLEEDYEVRYWTEKWGITAAELRATVDKVGNAATKVAVYLGKTD